MTHFSTSVSILASFNQYTSCSFLTTAETFSIFRSYCQHCIPRHEMQVYKRHVSPVMLVSLIFLLTRPTPTPSGLAGTYTAVIWGIELPFSCDVSSIRQTFHCIYIKQFNFSHFVAKCDVIFTKPQKHFRFQLSVVMVPVPSN